MPETTGIYYSKATGCLSGPPDTDIRSVSRVRFRQIRTAYGWDYEPFDAQTGIGLELIGIEDVKGGT